MAQSGLKISSRRKANAGGFDVESLNDKAAIEMRNRASFIRMLFSGIALIFGGLLFYAAIFYIPAFVQPKKILKLATGNAEALETKNFDKNSKVNDTPGRLASLFQMDRAFMKAGQSIEIDYNLPAGSYANLTITQCQRAWVIEIFYCKVVGQYSSRTERKIGAENFTLEDPGFYYFKHELVNVPEGVPYRIIWQRGEKT